MKYTNVLSSMQFTPPPWALVYWFIILVYYIWLFNIHPPFFTMTITCELLNWLFTSKGRNRIHDFFYLSNVLIFEDTSVTTSDNPRFSWFIFIIYHNRSFSFGFALTVLVPATLIALTCLSKSGLVNNCPWHCDYWRSASQEVCLLSLQLLMD